MRPAMIGSKGVSFFNSVGGNVVVRGHRHGDNPSCPDDRSGKVMLKAYDEGRLDSLHCQQIVNTMSQVPDHQPAAAVTGIR